MRFIKNCFLRLVSKRTNKVVEYKTMIVDRCMSCKTPFKKPAEMYVDEFVICKECTKSKRFDC